MKILMLTDTMDIGGAETHLYELSRSLSFLGHKVKILSRGGITAELLGDAGVDFEECGAFADFTASPASAVKKLLWVIRKFKPHVVHAHTRRALLCAQIAQMVIPFPLVFTAHAKFSPSPLKRFFTRPPAHSIAVSEDIAKHFEEKFGAKNMIVIKNGIDTIRFCPSVRQSGRFTIVHVSRLDKDSSLCARLLCKIAPRLRAIFPDLQIFIVGGGSDYAQISSLAKNANAAIGKPSVHAVGATGDVLKYLHGASIFVGVSRAALEAMCMGIPSIICGNEGYFGICKKESFKLCARENFCARGYEKASEERLFSDIVTLKRWGGENLRELVKEGFDSEKTAKAVEKVYEKAILSHKASLKFDAVICGYYGFGNLGDELVLSQIKSALGSARVAVIGASGEGRVCRFSPIKVAKAIRSSSVFILGGGSLLQNSTSSRSLAYYLSVLKIASFFGKRRILLANGIGPINGERAKERCRLSLAELDYASFRDEASFVVSRELLSKSTQAHLTCDPALFILPTQKSEKRLAVVIRGSDATSRLANALRAAISEFSQSRHLDIVFVSINKKEDERAARRLSASMPVPSRFISFTSANEAAKFIGQSQIILSSRLHALIIAAGSSRPFVALGTDPKLKAFCCECGLEEHFCIDTSGDRLDEKILAALSEAHLKSGEISQKLSSRVEELRSRAAPDKRILESISKNGRPD